MSKRNRLKLTAHQHAALHMIANPGLYLETGDGEASILTLSALVDKFLITPKPIVHEFYFGTDRHPRRIWRNYEATAYGAEIAEKLGAWKP